MSRSAKTANRRHRGGGRITPSKLRRTAVLTADGVLALSAGAIGGLAATAPASAGAPSTGWTGTQGALPSGPDAPRTDPSASLDVTSCTSATFCVASGSYEDSASVARPLLDVYSGGTWSAVEAPLPANADPTHSASMSGVSCPETGQCYAIGEYMDSSSRSHAAIDTLSGGHWTSAEAPVPSDSATGTNFDAFLKSIDCNGPGSCLAVGDYKSTNGGGAHQYGLIDSLTGGSWGAAASPQPADAATHQDVFLKDVSCPSMGPCVAVGHYEPDSGNDSGLLVSVPIGGGATAVAAPQPSGTTADTSALNAVSCAGANCEAVGSVEDTSSDTHGLLERLSGATWVPAIAPEPSNAGTGSNQDANLFDVSCTFDGICNAVGFYSDQANDVDRALIDTVSGATVTATEGPQPADAAGAANVDAGLNAVSCLSGEDCAAVGFYTNNSGSSNVVELIDQLSGSAWSSANADGPSTAATGVNAESDLIGVDCSSRGACLAVGDFHDSSSNELPLVDAYTPPEGYWTDASDGGIFTYGNAVFHGSMGGQVLNKPMVGMAETPGPGGYWEVASDGGIFSFGNAPFLGSTGSLRLNKPVVGMAATPDGLGYWLVASDGGIFNYGDAGFYGSTGALRLNQPVVGMTPTPDGHGYWLVASDGGIFSYGDAAFFGSRGGQPLNKPIVGMASSADGLGYWLVASDGGIFSYGDALFHGSSGSLVLNKPVVGMMSTFDGGGYWLVASDGGIFSYGNAGFQGSAGSLRLNKPMVGGSPT